MFPPLGSEQHPRRTKERRDKFRKALDSRIEDYRSGFTIHGLPFFCNGTRVEKLVWFLAMFGVLSFAFYMVNGYVKRYLEFEMRTEFRYEESSFIALPTMIFCVSSTYSQIMFCYKNISILDGSPCDINVKHTATLQYSNDSGATWTHAKYTDNGCQVINEKNTMSLSGKGEHLFLKLKATTYSDHVHMITLSPEEFQSRSEKVLPSDDYSFIVPGKHIAYISQTQFERLQYPYSPNCTKRHLHANPFSTLYSKVTCRSSCEINNFIDQCGDTPDYWRKYGTKKRPLLLNMSATDQRICLWDVYIHSNRAHCDCPLACDEIQYKTRMKTSSRHNHSEWKIYVLNEDNRVTKIYEVPDWTLEDLLGAVGGVLGLAIGASTLSVVELIVFSFLYVVRKVY